jgi:transcription elongation factor Elf1
MILKLDIDVTHHPNNFTRKGCFDYYCPNCNHWDSACTRSSFNGVVGFSLTCKSCEKNFTISKVGEQYFANYKF